MKNKIFIMIVCLLSQAIYPAEEFKEEMDSFRPELLYEVVANRLDQAGHVVTFEDRYPKLSEVYNLFDLDFKNDFIAYVRSQEHNIDKQDDEVFLERQDLDNFIELVEHKIIDEFLARKSIGLKKRFAQVLITAINNGQSFDQIDEPLFNTFKFFGFLQPVLQTYIQRANQNNAVMFPVIEKNNDTMVNFLLEHGVDVNTSDNNGMTALHYAAKKNADKVIPLLLDAGADVDEIDLQGYTPLHYAALHNANKVIRLLLAAGADLNSITFHFGYTPLHLAINAKDDNTTAQLLIELGANVNAQDDRGGTPLSRAAYYNADKTVLLLLKAGAIVDAANKNNGETALHQAATRNSDKVVPVLLNAGATVDARDGYGNTPLHNAAMYNADKILPLLLAAGADVNAQNERGCTPLHNAVLYNDNTNLFHLNWTLIKVNPKNDQEDIVALLLAAGADVHIKDNDGLTPLDYATELDADKELFLLQQAVNKNIANAEMQAALDMEKVEQPRKKARKK